MGRVAKVSWDKGRGAWVTTALGEPRETKGGRSYRTKVWNDQIPRKDRKAAEAWLAAELARRHEAAVRHVVVQGCPTAETVAELYLEDAERSGRLGREAAIRAGEHLTRFGDWPSPRSPDRLGARAADRVAPDDLEAYVAALEAKGLSRAYIVDGLLKTVRACFRWAATVRAGAYPGLPLRANPLAGYRPPEKPRRAGRRVDLDQVDAFFAYYHAWAAGLGGNNRRFAEVAGTLLEVLRATGARPKEVCTATWADWSVRPDGVGVIRLDWRRWKNGRKTREERVIAVPPAVAARVEAIRVLPDRHPTAIFVRRRDRGAAQLNPKPCPQGVPFVASYDDGDTKQLQKWFARVRTRAIAAGVPIPPEFRLYWFRSIFSTEARRAGVVGPMLAKGMGTSEAMLDRHYTDLEVDDMAAIAAAVEAAQPRRSATSAPD